jgi:Serine carboxypeptidase S28
MKWKASLASAVLCLGALAQALSYGPNQNSHMIHILGPQGVNLWKLDHSKLSHTNHGQRSAQTSRLFVQDSQSQIRFDLEDKDKNPGGFRAQWFPQPLDHFDPKSQHVFHQRYWVNTRHYKPRKGAPVIVLDGGETSGEVCMIF